jgi:hypothetical protein
MAGVGACRFVKGSSKAEADIMEMSAGIGMADRVEVGLMPSHACAQGRQEFVQLFELFGHRIRRPVTAVESFLRGIEFVEGQQRLAVPFVEGFFLFRLFLYALFFFLTSLAWLFLTTVFTLYSLRADADGAAGLAVAAFLHH